MAITYKELGSMGGTFEKSLRPATTLKVSTPQNFLFKNKKQIAAGDKITFFVRVKPVSGSGMSFNTGITGCKTFSGSYTAGGGAVEVIFGGSYVVTEEMVNGVITSANVQKFLGETAEVKEQMAANGISTFDEYIDHLKTGRAIFFSQSNTYSSCTVDVRLLDGVATEW